MNSSGLFNLHFVLVDYYYYYYYYYYYHYYHYHYYYYYYYAAYRENYHFLRTSYLSKRAVRVCVTYTYMHSVSELTSYTHYIYSLMVTSPSKGA